MNLLDLRTPSHLDREAIIEAGSFYTPRHLVDEVERMVKPYLEGQDHVVIFDSSVGGGAFTLIMGNHDYRLADNDAVSCNHLAAFTDDSRVFHSNSLHEVSREKYEIPEDSYLVQVGNPPYNDTTSAYKKGEKGTNNCDEDLFDRDLGISFLKSYNKLEADLVCVLHPVAYLIKEANFKRLKSFRENYRIRDGVIFSSQAFKGTGNKKFPIMIGLYERCESGMDYTTIRELSFRTLDGNKTFKLSRYTTTDGYIGKYPPRKNDPKESPIGLYYYTFRDMNSLQRSASFQNTAHYNAIVVTLENLYKYAYLFALRTLFAPDEGWLYGNLSPLIDIDYVEKHRNELVRYAIHKHPVFKELEPGHIKEIKAFYSIPTKEDPSEIKKLEEQFTKIINSLVPE